MTTLAIPLLGDYVAPRFCSAAEFLIVKLADDGATTEELLRPTALDGPALLNELVDHDVGLLLCNGFNRCYLAPALARGLEVQTGLGGDARELVRLYQRGELERARIPFGFGGRRCGRGRGRGRGYGRGMNQKPFKGGNNAW